VTASPLDKDDLLEFDPLLMDVLLDHYRHPRNHGELAEADFRSAEGNPSCGDRIEMQVRTRHGRIEKIRFRGKGCIISQAAASILTGMVTGEPLDRIRRITVEEMIEKLPVPIGPTRLRCALLGLKVLRAAVFGSSAWPHEEEGE